MTIKHTVVVVVALVAAATAAAAVAASAASGPSPLAFAPCHHHRSSRSGIRSGSGPRIRRTRPFALQTGQETGEAPPPPPVVATTAAAADKGEGPDRDSDSSSSSSSDSSSSERPAGSSYALFQRLLKDSAVPERRLQRVCGASGGVGLVVPLHTWMDGWMDVSNSIQSNPTPTTTNHKQTHKKTAARGRLHPVDGQPLSPRLRPPGRCVPPPPPFHTPQRDTHSNFMDGMGVG